MASVKTKSSRPRFVQKFLDELVEQLAIVGINAEADSQRVRGTKLHRVIILSPQFEHVRHSERQDLIWRIADQFLTPDEQLRISMILTMTPEEFEGPA